MNMHKNFTRAIVARELYTLGFNQGDYGDILTDHKGNVIIHFPAHSANQSEMAAVIVGQAIRQWDSVSRFQYLHRDNGMAYIQFTYRPEGI